MSGEEPPMGEDCLVLNVWTSSTSRDRKRPVLVYLHGGAYTSGSGSWKLYDGVGLAQRGDAVAVTINHRLGALGYLNLAEVGGPDYAKSRSEEHTSELQSLMRISYAVFCLKKKNKKKKFKSRYTK